RHEQTFAKMALRLTGSFERVHFGYPSLAEGPPAQLPADLRQFVEFDAATRDHAALRRIADYVREHDIRVAFGFDQPSRRPGYAALRSGGVRHIVSYWGAPMSSLNSGVKLLLKRAWFAALRHRPDHYIFQSEDMRRTATHGVGIPRHRTSVVYSGVDTSVFRPAPEHQGYVHAALGLDPRRKVVYYSGHMEPRKGVHVIIKAAAHLVNELGRTDLHFVFLGNKGGIERTYDPLYMGTAAEGHITFAGYRDDVAQIQASSFMAVIATTGWDSHTMSAVEVAASGLPLVVSDLPGIRETVAEDTGRRFPAGDHLALARHIVELADDPQLCERLGAAGRRRILQAYTQEHQVRGLVSVVRAVTGLASPALLVGDFSNRTGFAWNNIYRLFERLALEFDARGQPAWVAFARYEPPLDWENARFFSGVEELPPRPRRIRELAVWLRLIRCRRIRILYLTDQPSSHWRYALFRLAGVRTILVHNRVSVPDPSPAPPERGWRRLVKHVYTRMGWVSADRTYAVSEFVRQRLVLKGCMPESRVVTILNGVDLKRFTPRTRPGRNEPLEIFCGGRASTHKGIHVLLEALAILGSRSDVSDVRLVYAGDGPKYQDLVSLADRLGISDRVEFLGEVESTESHVHRADIVVVPSIWGDACPSAVSEALACGKPLVATRVGGVTEIVGDGKDVALLVEPNDAGQLAEAIAGIINDPELAERLGRNARHRAEQALDVRQYHDAVVRQVMEDCGLSPGVAGSVVVDETQA
ncbi:MAG TPA: glycosyltransferase family 4 protein, partial [Gammaproteobacteria bacterium]|nr:glycosyltransferase family 4 protein [Gammaproteobacteria bacterium]